MENERDDILGARAADAMARLASLEKGKGMNEWEDESGSRVNPQAQNSTTADDSWKETVRGIFDMLMLSTERASDLECRILDLIESRHHDFFCVGKTMEEWKAEDQHG